MRTTRRQSTIAAGLLLGSALLSIAGCENGQSSRGGTATPGPSPAWIEHYHREQLRYEYEQQRRAEEMHGR